MQRVCKAERLSEGGIGCSDFRKFFSSTPIVTSGKITLSNPTEMADGSIVGFQDFPPNVLLRVSPSPALTRRINQSRETNLNLCADLAADLFRLVSARPFKLGQNVPRAPQGSTRPPLLGTTLPERRLASVSPGPLSPPVRDVGFQSPLSGRNHAPTAGVAIDSL